MHRFYIDSAKAHDSVLTLSERETHHALHVVRVSRGERVVVLDGAGHEFMCEVSDARKRTLDLRVLQKHFIPPLPYQITLIQAVPKGKTMDLIVQKATELGAHRIIPILSERTVSQIEEDSAAAKLDKWQATAIEAIKQCGSAWLPEIRTPVAPSAFLNSGERFELSLIATLQPGARHPREHVSAFRAEKQRAPKTVAVWVGPEGDFTPAEINAVRSSGALPITLGQLVLRSETAAI
ncbi:MAG: RsmE family RNA methyltransferase, partial [Verrucomicrobiota bacterium]